MTQDYWLYLEPYTYAVVKNDHFLLYNTLNGACIEEKNQPGLIRLINGFLDRKNMLAVPLSAEDLKKKPVAGLVSAIRRYFMGDLMPRGPHRSRPVQIPQDVKLMKKTEKKTAEEDGGDNRGGNSQQGYDTHQLLKHLTGLTIYLNNNPTGLPVFPPDAYKQFTAPCFQSSGDKEAIQQVDLEQLSLFLKESQAGMVNQIDILGGDIFYYPRLEELAQQLNQMPADKHYYVRYGQLAGLSEAKLELLSSTGENEEKGEKGDRLEIVVSGKVRQHIWDQSLQTLAKSTLPYCVQFIVTSPEEFEHAERLTQSSGIDGVDYIPYYNGKNMEFFQSAVFIDRQDIFEGRPGLRKIQARGLVNPLHYGRLTIMSDGGIYANLHEQRTGRLGKDSLYDCLYRTLEQSKAWRRRRSTVEPCKNCVFEALCPPISNYEYALGRFNLCHINVN